MSARPSSWLEPHVALLLNSRVLHRLHLNPNREPTPSPSSSSHRKTLAAAVKLGVVDSVTQRYCKLDNKLRDVILKLPSYFFFFSFWFTNCALPPCTEVAAIHLGKFVIVCSCTLCRWFNKLCVHLPDCSTPTSNCSSPVTSPLSGHCSWLELPSPFSPI
jgi:hypothetical protein